MDNTFWTALGTSLVAALVTSLGIYTIRRFADWGQRNTTYFMCFAAGILTGYLATLGMVLHEFPEGIITYLRNREVASLGRRRGSIALVG